MPARNVEAYIRESVSSVLDQKGAGFELLIADDASTDGTREKLKTYAGDSRVRVWRFNKQKGQAKATNFLMKRARGKYLAFCDADDKILPGFLKLFSRTLEKNPKVGVVYGNRLIRRTRGKLEKGGKADKRPSGIWDLFEGAIAEGGTMIRRSLVTRYGGFPTDVPYLYDCKFFYRLSEVTQFLYLDSKPLYIYRRRPRSLSKRYEEKHFRSYQLKILRQTVLRRYGLKVSW